MRPTLEQAAVKLQSEVRAANAPEAEAERHGEGGDVVGGVRQQRAKELFEIREGVLKLVQKFRGRL